MQSTSSKTDPNARVSSTKIKSDIIMSQSEPNSDRKCSMGTGNDSVITAPTVRPEFTENNFAILLHVYECYKRSMLNSVELEKVMRTYRAINIISLIVKIFFKLCLDCKEV
jgi:hypothetical protein